jgi:hypothetical protein
VRGNPLLHLAALGHAVYVVARGVRVR